MKLTAALAAAALSAAAAPVAGAAVHAYDVGFDLTYDYRGAGSYTASFNDGRSAGEVHVTLRGGLSGVQVGDDGRLAESDRQRYGTAETAQVVAASGGGQLLDTFPNAPIESAEVTDCVVTGATVAGEPEVAPAAEAGQVLLSPTAALRVRESCTPVPPPPGREKVPVDRGGSSEMVLSAMDRSGAVWIPGPAVVRVAPPAAGDPSAIRAVDVTLRPDDCPYGNERTEVCELRVHGTVSFTRTGDGRAFEEWAPALRGARLSARGAVVKGAPLSWYALDRLDLDASFQALKLIQHRDRPASWRELRVAARSAYRYRPSGRAGGYMTRDLHRSVYRGVVAQGATLTSDIEDAPVTWRGEAVHDDGYRRDGGGAWQRYRERCGETWQTRIGVDVSARQVRGRPGGRVSVELHGVTNDQDGTRDRCDVMLAAEPWRAFDTVRMSVPMPREMAGKRRITIPLRYERVRERGARRVAFRLRGALHLRRVSACRGATAARCLSAAGGA